MAEEKLTLEEKSFRAGYTLQHIPEEFDRVFYNHGLDAHNVYEEIIDLRSHTYWVWNNLISDGSNKDFIGICESGFKKDREEYKNLEEKYSNLMKNPEIKKLYEKFVDIETIQKEQELIEFWFDRMKKSLSKFQEDIKS